MKESAKKKEREEDPHAGSFPSTLKRHGLKLTRGESSTLQVNVGLLCNQACRHCHLEAGPGRTEVMTRDTMDEVASFAGRGGYKAADITGGATEMNPDLAHLIEALASRVPRIMLRTNLTYLEERSLSDLLDLLVEKRVVLVASLPSTKASRTESQRGAGVFEKSISMLKRLNGLGYGVEGSGLELNFVSNPTGAFLPASQDQAERKFKRDLERRHGVVFNNLYTFANAPLGRFRRWLMDSGNFEPYMARLKELFNPCTVDGLMCRDLVSVNWEGYLFDCDFNLARHLHLGGRATHVSEMAGPPAAGEPIATGEHCFACTAGSGFT